jgi:glutaredoxin 3
MTVPVEIYTTDYCAYCFVAKRLLDKRKIPYVEIDVSGNAEKRRWLVETTGRRTVPQIFIGGVSIGGSDELHELDKSGKLAEMLTPV